jgi:hypothetical protein
MANAAIAVTLSNSVSNLIRSASLSAMLHALIFPRSLFSQFSLCLPLQPPAFRLFFYFCPFD